MLLFLISAMSSVENITLSENTPSQWSSKTLASRVLANLLKRATPMTSCIKDMKRHWLDQFQEGKTWYFIT